MSPEKTRQKLAKIFCFAILILLLFVVGPWIPMLMYGASLELDRKLEGFHTWIELEKMDFMGEIEKIDKTDTRRGIDNDNNDIRDDVDDFVKEKAKTEIELLILQQMARGFQEIQEYETLNVDAFDAYNNKVFASMHCLRDMRSIEEANQILNSIDRLTANTSKRKERREDFENLPIYVINGVSCNVAEWHEMKKKKEREEKEKQREAEFLKYGLQGQDKNNDGIRDDVIFRVRKMSETPEMQESIKLMARGLQEIQAAETVNIDLYKSFYEKVSRAKSCLEKLGYIQSSRIERIYKNLEELTANSDERKKRRAKVDALPISKELLENKYPCS